MASVLESARFISSNASNVRINQKAVEDVSRKLLPQLAFGDQQDEAPPKLEPPNLSPDDVLNWLFLIDLLNFCFWSDEETLFTVSHGEKQWTGYQSLCAALVRATEEGFPVYRPGCYGNITMEKLQMIFSSDTPINLPLISKRRDNLLEAVQVLNQEFGGKVSELIRRSDKSAQKLVSLLVEHFPSFRDEGIYKGRKVSFLKRAQIFAADVWQRFKGQGYGEFHDIDTLTMFADYRVPQSLLYLRVLKYSDELMAKLRAGEHLEAGGEVEAEIRGCSIWAVELIRQQICRLLESPLANEAGKKGCEVNSVTLDFFLWNYAKAHRKEMKDWPIHRTFTIFY